MPRVCSAGRCATRYCPGDGCCARGQSQRSLQFADVEQATVGATHSIGRLLPEWHPIRLCARALTGLLDYRPDLVVSGINNGANLGEDTLYSGTVAAATEGFLFGIPSIAFSLTEKNWPELEAATKIAVQIVQHQLANPFPAPVLLSVNIPPLPEHHWSSLRVTRLGRRHPSQPVIKSTNPAGEPIYWIGMVGEVADFAEDTDFGATSQGLISMTPLQLDLTHYKQLNQARSWVELSNA